ncbi:MAG: alanine--tRNA ligase [Armatimonadota bacterium]|nr:alanine--tRNA ligase [Armatimonadota bacterium]
MQPMSTDEIRELFLRFFEGKGHLRLPSASLIPNDPTLLLTGAGMNPFKSYFMGTETPPSRRVVTCQKCVRVGDVDNVGKTPRHHTFFEMLGNFSFGDYFIREACVWAWEFSTQWVKLDPNRLAVTIYLDDEEAFRAWTQDVGLSPDRITRLGEHDNFWPADAPTLGPNGPCGPCSEIYYDLGPERGCGKPECAPGCDCDRWLEYWNLVFQVYDRKDGGVLDPLPQKNIDTGLGLERLASILQGTRTNFETDAFRPIIARMEELSGVRYGAEERADIFLRVIADHLRAGVFLVGDGVNPSNSSRGYVVRRLVRRAVLRGDLLGVKEPFLHELVPTVVSLYGKAYSDLPDKQEYIGRVLRVEEENFRRTLAQGMQRLEEYLSTASDRVIPGEVAFLLYGTFGFPLELVAEIAAERGFTVDQAGFDQAMEEDKRRAREGARMQGDIFVTERGALGEMIRTLPATEFLGYSVTEAGAQVLGIVRGETRLTEASEGAEVQIVLDRTPFYAEAGGQVGDTGELRAPGARVLVTDTQRKGDLVVHQARVEGGVLREGDSVLAVVQGSRRQAIRRNHSATHLLHAALRRVLGAHVEQKGSLVTPERLRFDFSHFQALSPEEVQEVETMVNERIMADLPVSTEVTDLSEAQQMGAIALFGEKYGEKVRVVRMGDVSLELCGGTHVERTGQIGLMHILSESSVGAGLRRIEAVTGHGVTEQLRRQEALLAEVAAALKSSPADAPARVRAHLEETAALRRQLEELKAQQASAQATQLLAEAAAVKDTRLIAARAGGANREALTQMADVLAQKLGSGAVVLAGVSAGGVTFVAKVTPDLVKRGAHAGNLVREVARAAGGGGGGRPDFAQAGGKDPQKVDVALAVAREVLAKQLAGS